MNIQLKRPNHKELIGCFPDALLEMERNYRSLQNDLAEYTNIELSDEDKAQLDILAKYGGALYEAWLLGQNAWRTLERRRTPLIDTNAFLLLLPGICAYASNRTREMKRAAVTILNEPYIVQNTNGQVDVIGDIFKNKTDSQLQELSYMYQGKPNKAMIKQRVMNAAEVGVKNLLASRSQDDKKIQSLQSTWDAKKLDEFYDLENEVRFIWHASQKTDLLKHIDQCLDSDDSPEIYQMFVCGLADFLEKVAAEYWHLSVNNNLEVQ